MHCAQTLNLLAALSSANRKKIKAGVTHFPSVASGAIAVRYRYYSSTIKVAIRACYYLVGILCGGSRRTAR